MAETLAESLAQSAFALPKKETQQILASLQESWTPAHKTAFEKISDKNPKLSSALAALFQGSPYFLGIAAAHSEFLQAALKGKANSAQAFLKEFEAGVADFAPADLAAYLRAKKKHLALLLGLGDCAGFFNLDDVTQTLSRFAEIAIQAGLDAFLRESHQQGHFQTSRRQNLQHGCGCFILGMGKLGASELNYSSDVDLIAFFDPQRANLKDGIEPQDFFVRLMQKLTKLLQEERYDGYVLRVDWRLRPDPGSTPLALSVAGAFSYYETIAQNWERAAFIKARPVAGDIETAQHFLQGLQPFIWRKYFDYAALADIDAMKREISFLKDQTEIKLAGFDVKQGQGGIRAIEIFTQSQQLLGGGKDAALRAGDTLGALLSLKNKGWIKSKAQDELKDAYIFLREIEHRLQMVGDAQTHALPGDKKDLVRFASFAGFKTLQDLQAQLFRHLKIVQKHSAALSPQQVESGPMLSWAGPDDNRQTLRALGAYNFGDPQKAYELIKGWHLGRYPALRAATARARLVDILPHLLASLGASANPDSALLAFDAFLTRLPGSVQLFSLLKANPRLLDLIIELTDAAPRLSEALGDRPRLLEALIDPSQFISEDAAAENLRQRIENENNEEDILNLARIYARERKFQIGVQLLQRQIAPVKAAARYSALAAQLVSIMHDAVTRLFETKHGGFDKGGSVILALGKLGSAEMSSGSDLDLILFYDMKPDEKSDGPKPLTAADYYARLTQRLINALSVQTGEGAIVDVDFRLRPSGNKGPLATSLASFKTYHDKEAWTWEKMALTRASLVSGPEKLRSRAQALIAKIIRGSHEAQKLAEDIIEMRALIAKEKPPRHAFDIKRLPGGLIDLEFLAQYLVLRHAQAHPAIWQRGLDAIFNAAKKEKILNLEDAKALQAATRLYQACTQYIQLCLRKNEEVHLAPAQFTSRLLKATGSKSLGGLESKLRQSCKAVLKIQGRAFKK